MRRFKPRMILPSCRRSIRLSAWVSVADYLPCSIDLCASTNILIADFILQYEASNTTTDLEDTPEKYTFRDTSTVMSAVEGRCTSF
jgi:hypothetical protein